MKSFVIALMVGLLGLCTTASANPTVYLSTGTHGIIDSSTAQYQFTGRVSSGRVGEDALGSFLTSDTPGQSVRFGTTNGLGLHVWASIDSNGVFSVTEGVTHSEAVFAPETADFVKSFTGQGYNQEHFRLSRGICPNPNAPTPPCDFSYPYAEHLLITPYNYGMALEYPSVIEVWSKDFSVHQNHQFCMGAECNEGARFWVGDRYDNGGLFITALDAGPFPGPGPRLVQLAADTFQHTSHGSMAFIVRGLDDSFLFQTGPRGSEYSFARIDTGGALHSFGGSFAIHASVDGRVSGYNVGDVLEISDTANSFRLSSTARSTRVAGVYTGTPAVVAGIVDGGLTGGVALATTGIVLCNVSAEGGQVSPGDLLVTATTVGYTMKAGVNPAPGTILGKAMQPWTNGLGKINVLVTLQ